MNTMSITNIKTKFFCTLFAILFAIINMSSCGKVKNVAYKDYGFYDKKSDISYVLTGINNLRPITILEAYAQDEKNNYYYRIDFEEPTRFLCDKVEGMSYVYRASDIPEITMKNFNPVSAYIFLEGTASLPLFMLVAEEKYRGEVSLAKDELPEDDSALVYDIRDRINSGTKIYMESLDLGELEELQYFELRMFSPDYPGLYYIIVFFYDTSGEGYLYDRSLGYCVKAPDELCSRLASYRD